MVETETETDVEAEPTDDWETNELKTPLEEYFKPDPLRDYFYTPGQIYMLSPSEIEFKGEGPGDPLYDPRGDLEDTRDIKEFAERMREEGFTSVINVVERIRADNTHYIQIVFGRRRVRAAKLAGIAEIPARFVDPLSPCYKQIGSMLSENELRQPDNPVNKARKAQKYLEYFTAEKLGVGVVPTPSFIKEARIEVGKVMGVTERRIRDLLAVLEMSPKVISAVETDKISLETVLEWKADIFEKQDKKLQKVLKAAGGNAKGKIGAGRAKRIQEDDEPGEVKESGAQRKKPTGKMMNRDFLADLASQDGVPRPISIAWLYSSGFISEDEALDKLPWLEDALNAAELALEKK